MITLLIDKDTNHIISAGTSVVLHDIFAVVDGGNTIADYGAERAYTMLVQSLPNNIVHLPGGQPSHKYIDSEIVPIEPIA